MNTIGRHWKRSKDENGVRPGEENVVPLDQTDGAPDVADDEVAEAVSSVSSDSPPAADGDVVEVLQDGDGDAVAERPDGEGDAPSGDPEGDESSKAGQMDKIRELSKFRVDGALLKSMWRSHSLGRIALVCMLLFALVVAGSYFFILQPIGTKMHEVSEQKNLLHDYVVIQQAGATIGTFKDGLMTGDQRLTVMSEVNLMAEGSGVKVLGDPELLLRRELSGSFAEYPVKLHIRASFHEIGEFLSLVESSPRFIIVESVEITSEASSSSKDSDATVLLALAAWEG